MLRRGPLLGRLPGPLPGPLRGPFGGLARFDCGRALAEVLLAGRPAAFPVGLVPLPVRAVTVPGLLPAFCWRGGKPVCCVSSCPRFGWPLPDFAAAVPSVRFW